MSNKELIEQLRRCGKGFTKASLCDAAADALEAADKYAAKLLKEIESLDNLIEGLENKVESDAITMKKQDKRYALREKEVTQACLQLDETEKRIAELEAQNERLWRCSRCAELDAENERLRGVCEAAEADMCSRRDSPLPRLVNALAAVQETDGSEQGCKQCGDNDPTHDESECIRLAYEEERAQTMVGFPSAAESGRERLGFEDIPNPDAAEQGQCQHEGAYCENDTKTGDPFKYCPDCDEEVL